MISPDLKFKYVSVSVSHACAISESDHLYCWGDNSEGNIGTGERTSLVNSLYKVDPEETYADVVCGSSFTCAQTKSGIYKCWGDNKKGNLGDNTTDDKLVPTIIPM